MEKIWYDHRSDNRYTWDKYGYGELLNMIYVPEEVRSLIYSPTGDNKAVMCWNFAPPFVKTETEGELIDFSQIKGYAAEDIRQRSNADLKLGNEKYEYTQDDVKLSLRIADALIDSDKPVAVILPAGDDKANALRAEALIKLVVHLLSEKYANSIGFISYMTNASVEAWMDEAEDRFGLNVRLVFKSGTPFRDRNIIQLNASEPAVLEEKIKTEYLAVMNDYLEELDRPAKTVLTTVDRFTGKISLEDGEDNFGFYGAAYAYLSAAPDSKKAMSYFISAYSRNGSPQPKNASEWKVIAKALREMASETPKTYEKFTYFKKIYDKLEAIYKPEAFKILQEYVDAESVSEDLENKLFGYASACQGAERGKFVLILAKSCWNDANITEKGLARLEKIRDLLPKAEALQKILSYVRLHSMTPTASKCPVWINNIAAKLSLDQANAFIGLMIGDTCTGKLATAVDETQKIFGNPATFNGAARWRVIFGYCPVIQNAILKAFFNTSAAENISAWWQKCSANYELFKKDAELRQVAVSIGIAVDAPDKEYEKFEKERIRKEREERVRQLKEQEREKKEREEIERISEQIRDSMAVLRRFAEDGGDNRCKKDSSYEKYTENIKKPKNETSPVRNVCAVIAGLVISVILMLSIMYGISGIVVGEWSLAAFKAYIVGKSMWITCALGLVLYFGHLLLWGRKDRKTNDNENGESDDGQNSNLGKEVFYAAFVAVMCCALANCVVLLLRLF